MPRPKNPVPTYLHHKPVRPGPPSDASAAAGRLPRPLRLAREPRRVRPHLRRARGRARRRRRPGRRPADPTRQRGPARLPGSTPSEHYRRPGRRPRRPRSRSIRLVPPPGPGAVRPHPGRGVRPAGPRRPSAADGRAGVVPDAGQPAGRPGQAGVQVGGRARSWSRRPCTRPCGPSPGSSGGGPTARETRPGRARRPGRRRGRHPPAPEPTRPGDGRAAAADRDAAGRGPAACGSRDVDRSGELWVYRPAPHKTAHAGRARSIPLGPRARAVLVAFLVGDRPPPGGFDAARPGRPRRPGWWRPTPTTRRAGTGTPHSSATSPARSCSSPGAWSTRPPRCSARPGPGRSGSPRCGRPGSRRCRRPAEPPEAAGEAEAGAAGGVHRPRVRGARSGGRASGPGSPPWHPNQLRHTFATEVRQAVRAGGRPGAARPRPGGRDPGVRRAGRAARPGRGRDRSGSPTGSRPGPSHAAARGAEPTRSRHGPRPPQREARR